MESAEAQVLAALPGVGELVDVLRHPASSASQGVRRIFAQFTDGTQLDLAIVPDADIQARHRRGGAPDFIPLYQAPGLPAPPAPGISGGYAAAGPAPVGGDQPDGIEPRAAYEVTGEQVREWAFLGWCALIDAHKYLRRGSLWEAHNRLHEARHRIWALWAAANDAMYPWHGLSQVLDHDPGHLPPGIEATVAALDTADLYRAARASAEVLTAVSAAAARRHPADLPTAMAAYVTRVLSQGNGGWILRPAVGRADSWSQEQ